jgi:DNA-binding GntR family transcriptional regulator
VQRSCHTAHDTHGHRDHEEREPAGRTLHYPPEAIMTAKPMDKDGAAAAALAQVGSAEALSIDRSSTAERVADVLRELIIRGALPAGTALREAQLVASLDVSRNTLREAFRLLGRERLVRYNLHRGVAVTELSEADVADIYRTRAPLELMAIENSAEAPRERLEELLELVVRAEGAADEGDWNQVATLNIEFHQRLVELIGSERIATFFRVIDAELRLAFAMVEHAPAFFRPFIPRNRAIAELLLAGDRDAAKSELKAYLAEAERLIRSGVSAV